MPQSGPRRHVNVPGFLGLFAGLALIVLGGYILYAATSYVGAFLFLISVGVGISVIGITRDFVENRRYTGIGSRGSRFSHGYGPIRNERKVEDEEERRRASGEED